MLILPHFRIYRLKVFDLIGREFSTKYSELKGCRISKNMSMKNARHCQVDYKKPNGAEEKLKKLGRITLEDLIKMFLDKSLLGNTT